LFLLSTHLAILVSGVGGTKPNKRGNEENEESEELEDEAWMKLLESDDGLLSLKPWKEVTVGKANKANLALALREVMRQAWGEYILFCHYFSF